MDFYPLTALTQTFRTASSKLAVLLCFIMLFILPKAWGNHVESLEQLHRGKKTAEAGRLLFNLDFKTQGVNNISCSSCHQANRSFASTKQFNRTFTGQASRYNAPALVRLNHQTVFGMERQDPNLVNQIRLCFQGNMGVTPAKLLFVLQGDDVLKTNFNQLFGRLSAGSAYQVIAQYLLDLKFSESKYDQFLNGDTKALSEEERAGYQLFMEHGCNHCHSGSELGGLTTAPVQINNEKVWRKVPTLRNIAFTAPYLHDGREVSLINTIDFMAKTYSYRALSQDEADKIARFLSTHSSSISDSSGEVFRAPH